MKITVTGTSTTLPDLLGTSFGTLRNVKSAKIARVSIQNTSAADIYIENWEDATVDWSYKLWQDREVEMNINDLSRLYFITAWASLDARIIAT